MKTKKRKLFLPILIMCIMMMSISSFAYVYPISAMFHGGEKYDNVGKNTTKKTVYAETSKYDSHTLGRVCVRLGSQENKSNYGHSGLYAELSETITFPKHYLGPHLDEFSSSSYWYEVK